jgi:2-succinyl-5-enolpyruvyl-6-hydroxy-3-cyclohexene-1-carboxylate synthase
LTEPSIPLEWAIIQELVMELPANANIFIGNSMPVRDLDACLNSNAKPLNIIANRGASGIDGCISTLAGIAAGSKEATIGMIGDLALFHDLNGLHALRNSNVILIVTNNGGGGIFHYLSQARLSNFEKNWLTPTELNISAAATLFNLKYQKINSRTAFATAIKTGLAQGGVWILEVTIDTEYSVTQHRAYWNAVVNYVKTSLQ